MAYYTINLYTTQELYNYCSGQYSDGYRAIKRAETFFEGAFDQHSSHSASVDAQFLKVPAPVEGYNDPFYADPCVGTEYYSWLHNWFRDWRTCNSAGSSADVHLLLTETNNTKGGAMAYDGYGTAITGKYIADLPSSYSTRGSSDAFDGMHTALHEFGHYAMGSVPDDHQRGDDRPFGFSGWSITPMLKLGQITNGENYCGDDIDANRVNGFDMYWDGCCTQEW